MMVYFGFSASTWRPMVNGVIMEQTAPVGTVDRDYSDLNWKRRSEVQNQRYSQLIIADPVECRLEEAIERSRSWVPS